MDLYCSIYEVAKNELRSKLSYVVNCSIYVVAKNELRSKLRERRTEERG